MTTTLERPVEAWEPVLPAPAPRPPHRIRAWFDRHRASLAWLTPVLVVTGIIQTIGIGLAPQRIDDEGTYVAQAWAITHLGELAHYTYWYDHPPLGWLQLAGWTALTGGFQRYAIAVMAGREFMVVAALVSTLLVFLIGRRIGFTRLGSAIAALVFAISPLAVQYHRTVYIDNIATPWLLAAILLAMTRRNQLAGFAAAAASFGIAVLSKETFLLALPLVAWLMLRGARVATRRYTVSVAAAVLVLVGGGYLLYALVKGELLPSPDHTSLINGILFQLGGRSSSGSIVDPSSLSFSTLALWFQLDPVLCIVTPIAAVLGIFVRRIRPFSVVLLAFLLFMLRPGGYLPVPYVIMLLPLAVLVLVGVGEASVRVLRKRRIRRIRRRVVGGAVLLGLLAAVVVAAPAWASQLRGLMSAPLDAPSQNAQTWIEQNVPKDSRLIVDDSMWVDLVQAGYSEDDVIWFYKLDTDSAVQADNPQGWRDSDYVVTTRSMLTSPNAASADQAIQYSRVVASFGTGDQQVQVRHIEPAVTDPMAVQSQQISQRSSLGYQVGVNPAFMGSAAVVDTLHGGHVDERITLLLGQLLAQGKVQVTDLPSVPGEEGLTVREMDLASVAGHPLVADGQLTTAGRDVVATIGSGAFAAQSTSVVGDSLRITYPVLAPAGLVH